MVRSIRKRGISLVGGLKQIPGFRCQAPEVLLRGVNIKNTGLSAEEVQKLLLEEAAGGNCRGGFVRAQKYLRFSLVSAGNCWRKLWSASSAFRNWARRFCVDL